MATPETPDTPAPGAQTDPPPTDNTPDADNDGGALRKLRQENKSLRERLRESEGATAALSGVVDTMRTTELHRMVSDRLADPADLTVDMTELLGDDGQLDAEKVDAAVGALLDEKPHFAKQSERPAPPPSDRPVEGLRPGASPEYKPAKLDWHTAIRGSL